LQLFGAGGSHTPFAVHVAVRIMSCVGHVVSSPGVHAAEHTWKPLSANGTQLPLLQSCSVLHGSYAMPMHFCPPSDAGVDPVHPATTSAITQAMLRIPSSYTNTRAR
jgi:hypothetical protein